VIRSTASPEASNLADTHSPTGRPAPCPSSATHLDHLAQESAFALAGAEMRERQMVHHLIHYLCYLAAFILTTPNPLRGVQASAVGVSGEGENPEGWQTAARHLGDLISGRSLTNAAGMYRTAYRSRGASTGRVFAGEDATAQAS
jgi:hypothetical protein